MSSHVAFSQELTRSQGAASSQVAFSQEFTRSQGAASSQVAFGHVLLPARWRLDTCQELGCWTWTRAGSGP